MTRFEEHLSNVNNTEKEITKKDIVTEKEMKETIEEKIEKYISEEK